MKSDRRHELQHNQLADTLGEVVQKTKPYARLIGGLVVLLIVLGVAYAYVSGKGGQRVASGWDEYFEALESEDRDRLTEVAEKYAGTSVAAWARVVAADMALSQGCASALSNKTQARDLLRQAVNNYQTVLGEAGDDTLKQRALFGLARGHESLATLEDLNKARDDYKKLVEDWPQGVYAEAAKERLKDLERRSTKEFYDWFAKHEPPAKTGLSGKRPDFLENSLDQDIKLPSAIDDLKLDGPALEGEKKSDDLELPDEPSLDIKGDDKPAPPADANSDDPANEKPEGTSSDEPTKPPVEKSE